jgi:hypothetical protein
MHISTREWATPLTAGAFLLMAVTGVLIFFHLDSGLNKAAHEWLGWAMIVGVAAHIVANFPAFKRYLGSRLAQAIVGAFAVILLVSFLPLGEGKEGRGGFGGPPVLRASVEALTNAPLSVVAQVAKKDEASLIEDLKDAGYEVKNTDQTIDDLSLGDRRQRMDLLATIFE